VLVERGDHDVLVSTVENAGARFSQGGFAGLVKRSNQDDRLAMSLSARSDLPLHLFLRLLATASDAVRIKLQAEHPRARREVHQVVTEVTERIRVHARAQFVDYSDAQSHLKAVRSSGQFNAQSIDTLAKELRYEESIAALALMCELPIDFVERAVTDERPEMLLILAKAVGLSWATTKAVLCLRAGKKRRSIGDIEQCLAQFERLKTATAQQLLQFHRAREGAGTGPKA
jgi:uncharacterized protein (DUF2336 family)